jgi:hypothetical protein
MIRKSTWDKRIAGADLYRTVVFDGRVMWSHTVAYGRGDNYSLSERDDPAYRDRMAEHLNREARAYSLLLLCERGPVSAFRPLAVTETADPPGFEVEVVEAGVTLRLALSRESMRPIKVSYGDSEPSGGSASASVEIVGSHYKAVDGILLPHQVIRSSDGVVEEVLVVERFVLDELYAEDFRESAKR